MNKKTIVPKVFVILSIAYVVYIYHNSMFSVQQSYLQSGSVQNVLNHFFASIGLHVSFDQYAVRKLAHFAEYFIFGILLTATLRIYSVDLNQNFYFELFLFFAIPILDESIQMFYSGRTSSVIDVIIDFFGSFAGLGLCRLLVHRFDSERKSDTNGKK